MHNRRKKQQKQHLNQLEKNPCLHLTGGLSSKFEIGTLGNGESSLLGEKEPITHNEEMILPF